MRALRPSLRSLAALAALALLGGCPNTGVVVVSVVFAPASASQCTRLELVTAKSAIVLTEAVARPQGDDTVRFGIAPGKTLEPGQLYVTALGYRSPTCDGPTEERSERVAVQLGDPGAQRFTVTLRGKPGVDGGVDADHDGVAAPLDCDDTDPDVKPGGSETRCGNQKDDDCDGKRDCADGDCDGLACPDQDLCTSAEVCSGGTCQAKVLACEDAGVCGVAPGGCDAGVCVYPVAIGRPCDADGGLCRSSGVCATGEAFCGDGTDDDHDGLTDCADPDCFAQTCDAGAACVIDQACQTDHTCRGAMRACPASGCFATAACSEPAGCQGLTLKDAGAACGDGGTCQSDGGCSLVELNCGNGVDDDGDGAKDCLDPDCAGAQCNDANACSVGEVCSAGTCGGGTAVTCSTPTNPCLTALACDPTAGCQTSVATFAACPAGYCLPDAGCGNPFRYAPTGFDPQVVPQPAGRWLVDCQTDIDTTPGATNTFCHDGGVTLSTLSLDGGDALLITTQELAVTDGGLGFHGTRPVVIAVYGHAFINGFVTAIHSGANPMQPAGGDLPMGPLSPGCAQGDGRGADGTTTGGGSPESGGGSGGAFGAPGGLGGAGNSGATAPGAVRPANGNAALFALRGGCAGGRGGQGGGSTIPLGGAGGGGLQLSVAGTLTLGPSGRLGAPGLGGQGGNIPRAGGGGGSGGALIVEAHRFVADPLAFVTANGGSGGSGSTQANAGADGPRGGVAVVTPSAQPAANAPAGQGARGGALAVPGGSDGGGGAGNGNSGGGGGGSVGRIRLTVAAGGCSYDAGSFSPLPFTNCP